MSQHFVHIEKHVLTAQRITTHVNQLHTSSDAAIVVATIQQIKETVEHTVK